MKAIMPDPWQVPADLHGGPYLEAARLLLRSAEEPLKEEKET
jgi:hypothetical protein